MLDYLSNLDFPTFLQIIAFAGIGVFFQYIILRWIFSIDQRLKNQQQQIELLKAIATCS